MEHTIFTKLVIVYPQHEMRMYVGHCDRFIQERVGMMKYKHSSYIAIIDKPRCSATTVQAIGDTHSEMIHGNDVGDCSK